MNEISINATQTMSSMEIVDLINANREPGSAVLQHKHFRDKVLKVLGENLAAEFSAVRIDDRGKKQPCYNLPKREATLMVMSESYKVQAAVYDRMEKLEHRLVGIEMTYLARTSAAAIVLAKAFGFTGNQALLSADRAVKKATNISPLELLGSDLIAESKDRLLTPTEIGKIIGGVSARKINEELASAGLQVSYVTTDGSKSWKPTEEGKEFAEIIDVGKKYTNGTPIQQVKWRENVISKITAPCTIH